MDVEFVSGPSDPDDPSDEPGRRGPRTPRWLPLAAVLIVAAVAATVIVQRNSDDVPHAAPSSTPMSTTPLQTANPLSAVDPTMLAVFSAARDTARAADIVREGSASGTCPGIAVGARPQEVIARTMVSLLMDYATVDVARVIDQDAGLCSVQVRARDKDRDLLVVRVSSPDGTPPQLYDHEGVGTIQDVPVEYVEHVTEQGWHVVVGVAALSGDGDNLPRMSTLQNLVSQAAFRW